MILILVLVLSAIVLIPTIALIRAAQQPHTWSPPAAPEPGPRIVIINIVNVFHVQPPRREIRRIEAAPVWRDE